MRVVVLFLLMMVSSSGTATVIELEEPEDIRDVESLDAEFGQLITKVRQCAAAGIAPARQCYCYYPAKLASTRSAYDRLLSKHPEWKNRPLRWRDRSDSYVSSLDLGGLSQRILQPCI